MKALTLTQPWATLVAIEAKRIETRSWPTQYRGPLAIHVGAGLGPVGGTRGLYDLCQSEPFRTVLREWYESQETGPFHVIDYLDRQRGKIVATCYVVGCEDTEWAVENNGLYKIIGGQRRHWPLTDQERAFGDYTPGRYAWLLADVRPLAEPIPAKGALGLWEWGGQL